jgi:hypothetical protein
MKCLWTSHRAKLLAILSAFAVAAIAGGCATTAPPAPDESLLSAAGFKVLVAKTAQQQEHLQSLPPGKIRAMERNGTPYFVYPDAVNNRIYVGTQKEYQAYLRLHPENNGNPQNQLNAQQAADLASYGKQDDAMQKATKRDLSDPYFFWPSFDDLVR